MGGQMLSMKLLPVSYTILYLKQKFNQRTKFTCDLVAKYVSYDIIASQWIRTVGIGVGAIFKPHNSISKRIDRVEEKCFEERATTGPKNPFCVPTNELLREKDDLVSESQSLDIFYIHTQFGVCCFRRSGDMIAGVEIEKLATWPWPRPFGVGLLSLG